MAQIFLNNCYATLAQAITASDTQIELSGMNGFPASLGTGDFFLLTLYADTTRYGENIEVVKVTGLSGTTLTVERGFEGDAVSHSAGERVESRLTASSMNGIYQAIDESGTKALLTKSFVANEERLLLLTKPVDAPIVSVAKETPQIGKTNNSWVTHAHGDTFDAEDTAYATTLTPSATTGSITLTLGAGAFTEADVGKTITGNSGICVLTGTDGSAVVTTDFADTSSIASGDWSMKGLVFKDAGIEVSSQSMSTELTHDIFKDGSTVATYNLNESPTDLGGNYPVVWSGTESYTAGEFGQAADFNGSSYLSTNTFPVNNISTVSLWANISSSTNSGVVFAFNTMDGPSYYYGLFLYDSGEFGLCTWRSDIYGISGFDKYDGWHHFVFEIHDDNYAAFKLYIDGVEQSVSQVKGSSSNRPTASGIVVGGYDGSFRITGAIDQIRVFDRALSLTEVESLYVGLFDVGCGIRPLSWARI